MFNGGANCYIQGKLPYDFQVVPGDKIEPYLTFMWAHDGSGAFKAFLTYIRIFCKNQYSVIAADMNMLFKFRHTRNIQANAVKAANLLVETEKAYNTLQDTLSNLANKPCTKTMFRDLVHYLYPDPEEGEASTRTENIRTQLWENYHFGKGQSHQHVPNTAWAALNAVTEFTTHQKSARGNYVWEKHAARPVSYTHLTLPPTPYV